MDKKDTTTPKPTRRGSAQRAQFQDELSGANEAMRIAIEKYIAASKKLGKRVTYIDIANKVGISGTYIYYLKNHDKDVSTQMIRRILLEVPEVEPYFNKAYNSIIKKRGYKGNLVGSVAAFGDPEEQPQDLIALQNRIAELEIIIKTKDELIVQLLNKLHV